MKNHRWLDLSTYGMKLVAVIHPSGTRILIVENGDKQPDALRRLGFKPHKSGSWYNNGTKSIAPRQYLRELPETVINEFPESEILTQSPESKEIINDIPREADQSADAIKQIGFNRHGQKVFEAVHGERFVTDGRNSRIWEQKADGKSPDMFLRITDDKSLTACVEGFIETRLHEGNAKGIELDSFATACGLDSSDEFTASLAKCVKRWIFKRDNLTLQEMFKLSISLHNALEGTPAGDVAKTHSLALIGRKLLGSDRDLIGKRIRISGFDRDLGNRILPKAALMAKKDCEFDIELKNAKNSEDGFNSARSLEATNRFILLIRFDSVAAAGEFVERLSAHSEIEACAFLTDSSGGTLALSAFGNNPSSKVPEPSILSSQDDFWIWAANFTESHSKAVENARMGMETDARFMSAHSSLSSNDFQKPYASLSQSGTPTTMIPRELDSATRRALNRVASCYGDIDKAMAEEFGYGEDDFQRIFAPEQIDALALAINAEQRDRGFMIADGTGVGKGRPLAALIARAVSRGRKVIFISEKDSNLSDIQRDMKHIERLDAVTPLVLNEGVSLIDEETDKPFKVRSRDVLLEALNSGCWPEGVNAVYATYSQFNRRKEDSIRSMWLDNTVGEDTVLIVDEIHNASSGTSNTSSNISTAINRAGSVVYASATYAATSRMVSFYERLFPDDIDSVEMGRMIAKGGEPLQEVITNMLVADGMMIRRERDLSSIEFSQHLDSERMDRNLDFMDKLASVIAEMASVSVDIADAVRTFNGNLARLRDGLEVRMMPFGTPLHSLTRFATACLCAQFAAERAVEALGNEEKPVIMVDNTIQAILEECYQNGTPGPDFKAVVHRVFTQLTNTLNSCRQDTEDEDMMVDTYELLEQSISRVRVSIDRLPDLPAYPIDIVRKRIEDAGYSCGEITGRMLEVRDGEVSARTDRDRTRVKNGFNRGDYDGLIINLCSSTGIDLHSSKRFKDQRRRVFIELQSPQSVQRQVQAFGRISRRDEVTPPRIELLSTGLPSEIRLAAMRNRRLRRMSATVTSNRDSAYLTKHIPDIINSVGDAVITNYAELRPDLLKKLCLDPESLGREEKESGNADEFAEEARKDVKHSANTFLSRLSLLPTKVQENIIGELFAEYEFHIAELEARGENPLRPREIEGIVHLGAPVLFEGAISGDESNSFDGPLFLHNAKIERVVKAIDSDSVLEAVEDGSKHMSEVLKAVDQLERNRNLYLETYLSGGSRSVDEAISRGDEKVKRIRDRMDDLCTAIPALAPGRTVRITLPDESAADAVITRIYVPKAGFEHMPHQYRVKLAIPGEVRLKTYFVSTLLNMSSVAHRNSDGTLAVKSAPGLEGEDYDAVLKAFDNQTSVKFTKAMLLMTNIYRAARIATKHKAGSLVSLVDSNGIRHKGVIVRKGFEKKLAYLPYRVDGKEAIHAALIGNVKKMDTSPGNERTGITILATSGSSWSMTLPRPRRRGERTLWKSDAYRDLHTGGKVDERGISTIEIYGRERLSFILTVLEDAGYPTFFIDPKHLSKRTDSEESSDNNIKEAT